MSVVYKLYFILFILLFNSICVTAQYDLKTITSIQNLKIKVTQTNKIPVFIIETVGYYNDSSQNKIKPIITSEISRELLFSKLQNIDTSSFFIHHVKVNIVEGCLRLSGIDLYGNNSLENFSIVSPPLRLLIKTDHLGPEKAKEIVDKIKDIGIRNEDWEILFNRDNSESNIYQINNYLNFLKITSRKLPDFNSYIHIDTFNHFKDKFFELEKEIELLKRQTEKLNYQLLNLGFNPLHFGYRLKGESQEVFSINSVKGTSVKINFSTFGILKNLPQLGLQGGIAYTNFNGQVTQVSDRILDTLSQKSIDLNGDVYTRLGYLTRAREHIDFNIISLNIGLSYLKFFPNTIYGLKYSSSCRLNTFAASSYKAKSGSVSFGGIYSHYKNNDTMFSGLYDFHQNADVSSSKESFDFSGVSFSWLNELDFLVKINSRLHADFGLMTEYSKNFVPLSKSKKRISNTLDSYNSLLYRESNLRLNNFLLKIGFTYLF